MCWWQTPYSPGSTGESHTSVRAGRVLPWGQGGGCTPCERVESTNTSSLISSKTRCQTCRPAQSCQSFQPSLPLPLLLFLPGLAACRPSTGTGCRAPRQAAMRYSWTTCRAPQTASASQQTGSPTGSQSTARCVCRPHHVTHGVPPQTPPGEKASVFSWKPGQAVPPCRHAGNRESKGLYLPRPGWAKYNSM